MEPTLTRKGKVVLRAEVLAAAVAEIDRVGVERFRVAALAERFGARGVPRSTLYRWVATAMNSGLVGQGVQRRLKDAAGRRASAPGPELAAAIATLERLPRVSHVDDIAGEGSAGVLDYLREAIKAARQVMSYARTPDGQVRAAKLLIFGSEHLRRCVETAARVTERFHEIQKVEEFHRIIMEEVRKESPEVAMAILTRIDQVSQLWGAL